MRGVFEVVQDELSMFNSRERKRERKWQEHFCQITLACLKVQFTQTQTSVLIVTWGWGVSIGGGVVEEVDEISKLVIEIKRSLDQSTIQQRGVLAAAQAVAFGKLLCTKSLHHKRVR